MNHSRRIDVDTPSIMFAALTSRRWGRTFRLSAMLDRDVDPAILESAVRATLPAFPNMRLTLRRGFFWAKQVLSDAMPEMRGPEGKTGHRGRRPRQFRIYGPRSLLENDRRILKRQNQ